jgi:hypothetical protein
MTLRDPSDTLNIFESWKIMLKIEYDRYVKAFQARRSSKLEHIQTDKKQFSDLPPNLLGDAGSGWTVREGDSQSDPNNQGDSWRDHLHSASSFVERAISSVENDPALSDSLALVLRAVNSLKAVPNGSLIPWAKPNRDGSEPTRHVASNATSRRTHTIDTSELAKDDLKEKIMRLTAKMRGISAM